MKYSVLIPAYNAGETIGLLLKQLSKIDPKPQSIIVVDDGSNDDTAKICQSANVNLIQTHENRGKGSALREGFEAFLEMIDIPYLICMDADLQHPVASIPDLLQKSEDSQSKFVIGARTRSLKTMPAHRILSNSITSWILSRLTGQYIQDSQCGFRLMHRDVFHDLTLTENGYQVESEIILRAAKMSVEIENVAIPTIYNSEKSHIGHVSDTLRFVRLVLRDIGERLKWSTKKD